MARYARGRLAWGRCARTGDKVLLRDLVKDGDTGLLVTREAYEPKHPQEKPVNVYDPQTLRRMAPDVENTGTFTTATFTWDPGEIADGAIEVKSDIAVDGAAVGATVIVYPGVDLAEMLCSGYVSAPGKVSVALLNLTGSAINLGSSTWQVLVTAERNSKDATLYVAGFNWDPSALVDGGTAATTVAVSSAAVGDAVLVYPAQPLGGVVVNGYVSESGVVEVVLLNMSGAAIQLGPTDWPRWTVAVTPDSAVASNRFFGQSSLSASFTWDPGEIVDGASVSTQATVTGAAVGDAVILYPGVDLSGMVTSGYVMAADTVEAVIGNLTGAAIDLASSTWNVRVLSQ